MVLFVGRGPVGECLGEERMFVVFGFLGEGVDLVVEVEDGFRLRG